jgi:hypothetical protein
MQLPRRISGIVRTGDHSLQIRKTRRGIMRNSIRWTTLLFVVFALGACDDDDNGIVDPTPDPPVANAGADQTVEVGSTVTLDGTGSTTDAASLTYSWAFLDTPEGSEAALEGANTAQPTFVADLEGQYVAELTVTDVNGTDSDTVTVTAGDVDPGVTINEDITEDTTLSETAAPYTVDGEITVFAALIIEPGVEVHFTEGSRLIVAEGGSVTAVGTEEAMIRMVGVEETAGYWNGIEFQSDSEANLFDYVEVGYGGGEDLNNILLSAGSSASITNSFIHNSASWGIFVDDEAAGWTIEDNTYEDNASGDVRLPEE